MQYTYATVEEDIYDLIIVGAGLSGVGTGYWLQHRCPGKKYVIFEARDSIGGTWDLFRYPGIRSDSDMFTFGYAFRPWKNPKVLADGESIREYITETAKENGIDKNIRFRHKVSKATWSSEEGLWTVHVQAGEATTVRSRFLYMCSGYYSYEESYRPVFEGEKDFKGKIVIPQFWPEDLDYSGKNVVIIGSGATAVTLVPTMAETANHVTMLQRSPTYILPLSNRDKLYKGLKKLLPDNWAYKLTRWKNLMVSMAFYRVVRRFPNKTKSVIKKLVKKQLGSDYAVEKHFNPKYNPWDQRLCIVPDGDLFKAIRKGKASVVTDHIAHFTDKGIHLRSGQDLYADIIVLATGLKLRLLGGAKLEVDGKPVNINDVMMYKGMMLSEVPNFAMAFGYTNASWTLKTDLTANYICKLFKYMDRHGYTTVVPHKEEDVKPEPLLDFESGYIKRANHILPQQGSRRPWRVYQNYFQDMLTIRYGKIDDGTLKFGKSSKDKVGR